MYIDTHCHLNFEAFEKDWKTVAQQAIKAGVKKMVVVGADLKSSQKAVEIAQNSKELWAATGIHPHHAAAEAKIDELKKLIKNKKVAAIGECGLDYHVYQKTKYENNQITLELKQQQKRLFGQQIQLAKELSLPLIIHNREAGEDIFDVLDHFCKSDGRYPKGVFHCISGSKKLLQKILEAGFYIGVDGNLTYSTEVETLVKEAPLERILLETDSPWLTPEPNRGLRNTPESVKITALRIAKIKKLTRSEVKKVTTKNATELFKFR